MKNWISYTLVLVGGIIGGLLSPLARPAVAQNTVYQGQQLWILGSDGRQRIQLGTYASGGEAGQPAMGLTDNHGHLRFLFRLAGRNDSPVLVMKDRGGRDRLVMGLGLNDDAQEPFLAVIDSRGQKKLLTGSY
ncbi:MAG TPA: hypothetical protein VGO93_13630 [Candidatus Xenobia bacterium]|jgi:hypothetical protein